MRICLDLDNTICQPKQQESDDYYLLEPYPEAIVVLQQLKAAGDYIIIHTARGMKTCNADLDLIYLRHYDNIVAWLQKWNIPYDELILGKPLADLYIDDKAIYHKNWFNTNEIISYEKETAS